ncbi:MAG TPA: CHASE3 domain-containing protein, partial [Rhizomicrobium sp.]|nr:CHASE3 domain-containing protein [Rhizomicrobium sp.]
MIHRPKKSQTKDQAVAVVFRLFLGGLVIIRLLTCLSASDWEEIRKGPPPQEVLAKLDALTATLDSTELCRRAYDLTHDPDYLFACQRNARTVGERIDALRVLLNSNAGLVHAVDLLDPAIRNWMDALCRPDKPRQARPRDVAKIVNIIHDSQTQSFPSDTRVRAEQAFSGRLVALALTLVELAVLVLANWAFHRFMGRRRSTEEVLRRKEEFARSTVDALATHIAILDGNGIVLAVNRAWREYRETNGADMERVGEGVNYLIVCDAAGGQHCAEAAAFGNGIRAVLAGKQEEFSIEYASHSRQERRWFVGRVTRFPGAEGSVEKRYVPRLVISHDNITARKLAEEALQKAK